MTTALRLVYSTLIFLGFFPTSWHRTLYQSVGANVTLDCSCQKEKIVMCFWYKQSPGHKPVQMSSYYKHNTNGDFSKMFKDSRRFSLDNSNRNNTLMIKNLRTSDAATYFCMSSNMYNLEFLQGITLNVENAELDLKTLVREVEDSHLEGSVTLHCSLSNVICDGADRVYWFKNTEDSHAGVLHSHGGSRDQCKRNTDSQSKSCVYNLPIQQQNGTDDSSKCAVASCGQVLFGNERDGYSGDKHRFSVLVYILSGALVLTIILIFALAFSMYKIIKTKPPPNVTTENEDNLHYAALKHQSSSRPQRQTGSTTTECVYSGVRL